jgi:hypothetical protein
MGEISTSVMSLRFVELLMVFYGNREYCPDEALTSLAASYLPRCIRLRAALAQFALNWWSQFLPFAVAHQLPDFLHLGIRLFKCRMSAARPKYVERNFAWALSEPSVPWQW